MRTAFITNSLRLLEVPVEAAGPKVAAANNHIWIVDRSGSMWPHIEGVMRDLIERLQHLPNGDTLTVGWFSSEGQFGYLLKGTQISDATRKSITDILRRNANAIAATCFSDILADTNAVITDLTPFSTNFHLMFLSDGYPTVSNHQRELERIKAAIEVIAGRLNSVLVVGYGDFYNRELLSNMAQAFGGALVHSSNLPAFSKEFGSWLGEVAHVESRIPVKLPSIPHDIYAVFSISGEQVTVYPTDLETIMYAPTGNNDAVYVLYHVVASGKSDAIKGAKPTGLSELERGAYAAAFVLSQRTRSDLALDILGAMGDVRLIDAVNNAYTNEEAGTAELLIKAAAVNPSQRFLLGRNTHYLPDPYAFCVLDALDLLADDKDARFYPSHPDFSYKKITRGAITKDGYPKFTADQGASSPLSTLTYNDEKLNVSIKTTIPGTVPLRDGAAALGFGDTYPCVRIRDYAIIADGILNVQQLPVSLSAESFNRLRIAGIIDDANFIPGMVYTLHLNRLPIINRGMAEGRTSARALCRNVMSELQFEGRIKAFKALRDELDPNKEILRTTTLTAEQEAFLAEHGITAKGVYSPPTERAESTDFYMAKHFRVKAKGFSTLPSVKEVRDRYENGKTITPAAALVLTGLAEYESNAPKFSTREALAWLDDQIATQGDRLKAIRRETQRTKFAVLLSKKWFDEFTSREDSKLEVEGVEFTIVVEEKKVDI